MSIADTEDKFLECTSERLGNKAKTMLDALKRFDEPGAIEEVAATLGPEVRMAAVS